MKVAITGSTGFIGTHLTTFLSERGLTAVPLSRTLLSSGSDEALKQALTGCEVVLNLAGATLNRRWTKSYKQTILESRVRVTHRLTTAINELTGKPALLISISAIGIYPPEGVCTENSTMQGTNFLAQVCGRWEEEAERVSPAVRLVIARLGVVLAADGGALPKMLLPFRLFLGGRISTGLQGFSWIHIEDVLHGLLFVIEHPELSGVVNFTSPQPVTNAAFTRTLSQVMNRPKWFCIPSFLFRLLYGEAEILFTEGQKVYPSRLLSAGYIFRYGRLKRALQSLI